MPIDSKGVLARRPMAMLSFAGLVICLVGVELVVATRLLPAPEPLLAAAITIDLVVLLPLAGWWLLVRRMGWSPLTLAPLFLVAVAIADAIIPPSLDQPVRLAAMAVPVVELSAIGYILIKIRRLRDAAAHRPELLWFDKVRTALHDHLGGNRIVAVLATEIGLLTLFLVGWRMRPPEGEGIFSSHRDRGVVSTMIAFLAIAILELALVHLLVSVWSETAAWVLTALSAYGIVWLVGDVHGLRIHPHVIDGEHIRLRIGLRWWADIPKQAVCSVTTVSSLESLPDEVVSLTPLGEPNVLFELDTPAEIHGPFGLLRRARLVAVAVDQPANFIAMSRRDVSSCSDS